MTVYGLSQSTGVERVLEVEQADQGVLFHVHDKIAGPNQERIVVSSETLINTLADPPSGGATIEGVSPTHGATMPMDIDIRGNEVLLCVRPAGGGGWDVAVGLDDFQDAIEQFGSPA